MQHPKLCFKIYVAKQMHKLKFGLKKFYVLHSGGELHGQLFRMDIHKI